MLVLIIHTRLGRKGTVCLEAVMMNVGRGVGSVHISWNGFGSNAIHDEIFCLSWVVWSYSPTEVNIVVLSKGVPSKKKKGAELHMILLTYLRLNTIIYQPH